MSVAGGGTEGSDTNKEGWMATEEQPHPHRGLAKTDAGQEGLWWLRNTRLYRKHQFAAFTSINLSVKIKPDTKMGMKGNFISYEECMLISTYSRGR